MTTKILEAFKENEGKFKDIEETANKIREKIEEKKEVISEIMNICKIVFKNFNTERKETPVKIGGAYSDDRENNIIFINQDGISLKSGSYQQNTSYIYAEGVINFVKYLKQIKLKESELLPFIRENKKLMFKQFIEKAELLEIKEEIKRELEKELIVYSKDIKPLKVIKVEITPRGIGFEYSDGDVYVSLKGLSLNDKLIIEQVYDKLKGWLQEYLEIEQTNLSNANLVLEDLKAKFSKQMIINSLSKKK